MGELGGLGGDTHVVTPAGVATLRGLAGCCSLLLDVRGRWRPARVLDRGVVDAHETVLSRCGVTKNVVTAPDQLWVTRSRRGVVHEHATDALRAGTRVQVAFPAPPGGAVDPVGIARGFVFGDGHRQGNRSVASFVAPKDLVMLPYFEGHGRPARRYGQLVRINGLPVEWKTSLPDLADHDHVRGWLSGYFAADGDVDLSGRPTLASALRPNLAFVRAACSRVGIGTYGIRTRWRTGFGETPSALHLVGLMRGDLSKAFFLNPQHRQRFLDGQHAAERRGWNVVTSRPVGAERVYVVQEPTSDGGTFVIEDNIVMRTTVTPALVLSA